MSDPSRTWFRELTRYHWFVLAVAALGWLFDTMDQQLFVLARQPAMEELLRTESGAASPADVRTYGSLATAVFLMGWATGGIGFGILGDRIGRAKTMLLTILIYSIFTGVSAFSRTFYDFALWRFLTGLGVGGEFAVGVSLVAEVMPDRARPFALGLLQALSAVGNITAALINMGLGQVDASVFDELAESTGIRLSAWRIMFMVGTLPALLALLIRRRLKEPERWQATATVDKARLGSVGELFGDPRWRKRALLGMLLASAGVIGLWGIGFFSPDLNRAVFREVFRAEYREQGHDVNDAKLLSLAVAAPEEFARLERPFQPADLIDHENGAGSPQAIYGAIQGLIVEKRRITLDAILAKIDALRLESKKPVQTEAERSLHAEYLRRYDASPQQLPQLAKVAADRAKELGKRLFWWAGITSIVLNTGAFFGIYSFSLVSHRIGRRPTFAIAFVAAMLSTAAVFWMLDSINDLWMVFVMGFCQLSLFGGYAIYFPELFPTRLRSTGTSFCYNVGRFVAAVGPWMLGYLSTQAFGHFAEPYPLRYAGVTMCGVFLLGLVVLPFLPETKGQPLPE